MEEAEDSVSIWDLQLTRMSMLAMQVLGADLLAKEEVHLRRGLTCCNEIASVNMDLFHESGDLHVGYEGWTTIERLYTGDIATPTV